MNQRAVKHSIHPPKKRLSRPLVPTAKNTRKKATPLDGMEIKSALKRLERACALTDGAVDDLYALIPNLHLPLKVGRRVVGPRPERSTIELLLRPQN